MFIRSFMLHAYVPPPTLIIFKYSKDGGKVIRLFQTRKLGAWGSWFLAKLTNMLINCNNFMCFPQWLCYFQHFSVGIVLCTHIHSIVICCINIVPHITYSRLHCSPSVAILHLFVARLRGTIGSFENLQKVFVSFVRPQSIIWLRPMSGQMFWTLFWIFYICVDHDQIEKIAPSAFDLNIADVVWFLALCWAVHYIFDADLNKKKSW